MYKTTWNQHLNCSQNILKFIWELSLEKEFLIWGVLIPYSLFFHESSIKWIFLHASLDHSSVIFRLLRMRNAIGLQIVWHSTENWLFSYLYKSNTGHTNKCRKSPLLGETGSIFSSRAQSEPHNWQLYQNERSFWHFSFITSVCA